MSSYRNNNDAYRGGGNPQWARGGGNQRHQNQSPHNRQQGYEEEQHYRHQSWPRQQQLPGNQGSWNQNRGDQGRQYQHPQSSSSSPQQQQRSQHGWQKDDSRRAQPGTQRPAQKTQKPSQQQAPRELKPPPLRPNAWGQASTSVPQVQSVSTTQQPPRQQEKQTTSSDQSIIPATGKALVTPEPTTKTNQAFPSAMGAWSAKLNGKGVNAATSRYDPPEGRKTPGILKPDAAGPPAKKLKNKHQGNKKDSANNNNNAASNKIHGKKPKLSSISMGDLVPNIKKIIPKDKHKKNASQALQAQSINGISASDFPALPTTRNWPSLGASKFPPKVAVTPVAAPKRSVTSGQPNPSNRSNGNSKNNNNGSTSNAHSKKRKNQSQQALDGRKGASKAKSGGISIDKRMTKPDASHLAAQFLLPPGKVVDPSHMQAQLRHPGAVGGENNLMRMMQGGLVKGRQRLKPRKKRFTALKRKILLERLRVWKELHPEIGDDTNGNNTKGSEASCTISVLGFASLEELEDTDEFEELLQNLTDMAGKMGHVRHVFIPRSSVKEDSTGTSEHPAFVHFSTTAEAMAARGVWDGLVIGGQSLKVRSLAVTSSTDNTMDEGAPAEDAWQRACLDTVIDEANGSADSSDSSTFQIKLKGVLTEDDLEDDECFAESIQDIKQLVEKFGIVEDVQTKKQEGDNDVVIVYKGDHGAAQSVLEALQELTLAGSQLNAESVPQEDASPPNMKLLLENILTEDDLEDEECLEESLNDVQSLLGNFGTVASLDATGTQIFVSFTGMATGALQAVARELNGTTLGGQTIKANLLQGSSPVSDTPCVVLRNLFTFDDLEDEDCLEESMEDIRELARQCGNVQDIQVEKADSIISALVKVTYSTPAEAEAATKHFHGMIVGGETISAAMGSNSMNPALDPVENAVGDTDEKNAADQDGGTKPMFSGDKRIPERFAACKRVPKVPNKGVPRNYAILTNNDTVKPLLVEMLNELMRLQLRALHDKNAKNAKARRRVVIGLREVARGIRANKVKMVVMANNLDQYGAIDDKLQEILDLSAEKEIPVLFELSKRVLGKALGKKIKVSVAALQATDGAHQQFVKLSALAPHLVKPSSSAEAPLSFFMSRKAV